MFEGRGLPALLNLTAIGHHTSKVDNWHPSATELGVTGGAKWHRLKTVTFTKQTGQFSQKSTPLSNGIGGIDKDPNQQAPEPPSLKHNYS